MQRSDRLIWYSGQKACGILLDTRHKNTEQSLLKKYIIIMQFLWIMVLFLSSVRSLNDFIDTLPIQTYVKANLYDC